MALEKTLLYSTNTFTSLKNIADYLKANAVPTYFDRVFHNEGIPNVVCYIGDLDFVTFSYAGNNIRQIKIKINTGVSYRECHSDEAATPIYAYYGFKTSYGISFTDSTSTARPICTICKDNDNNTTVVMTSKLTINKLSSKSEIGDTSRLYTANPHTGEFSSKYYDVRSTNLGITAVVPLYVGDTTNYTPDVMLLAYSQNVSDGILDINGVRYYSNGLWCVRIE